MAKLALLIAVVTTVFGAATAQLFPFSSLRSYIDQHHSESVELTTKAPPPVDAYRYLQESGSPYYLPPAVGVDVEHRGTGGDHGHTRGGHGHTGILEADTQQVTDRTVLVTPKPRYVPQRLIPEPNVDPNSPSIPSIGFGPGTGSGGYHEPSSLSSISSPVRSVTIEKPTDSKKGHKFESHYEPVLLKETPYKPYKTHYVEKTVVDSVPSLSVTIPLDGYKKKPVDGLIDYLTPPKFPSVYENHMKTFSSSPASNLIVDGDVKQTTVGPVKTKKKKKNKNKVKGDASSSGSEKRVRVRTRTPTFKTNKGEPLELHASGTEIYLRPSQSYRPPSISTPHPIEEQIAAETNFGLGGSGGGGGERVEFQLHGQSGPESYKFGFDTGDGKNRHFRYEEKDDKGNVKGHYGYYDKTGKLQVVNYHADKHGFHASSP